ncbi:MAG: hypothetical protein QOJ11_1433 [Frankiales bacterium]|jgi:hypothetical protein|nr:hypothetical protein [Frankiales bacterium]
MSQPNVHMAAATPGGDDAWDQVSDEDLVARVAAARARGEEDTEGTSELVRRAELRNRAALDRLSR